MRTRVIFVIVLFGQGSGMWGRGSAAYHSVLLMCEMYMIHESCAAALFWICVFERDELETTDEGSRDMARVYVIR